MWGQTPQEGSDPVDADPVDLKEGSDPTIRGRSPYQHEEWGKVAGWVSGRGAADVFCQRVNRVVFAGDGRPTRATDWSFAPGASTEFAPAQ